MKIEFTGSLELDLPAGIDKDVGTKQDFLNLLADVIFAVVEDLEYDGCATYLEELELSVNE